MTKAGVLTRGPKGYDLRAAVRDYIRFVKTKPNSLTNERARLVNSQADLHELKLRQRNDELVLRSAVEKKVFQLYRQTRDTLLNIPARLSGILAAETDQEAVFQLLTTELTHTLEGLSDI